VEPVWISEVAREAKRFSPSSLPAARAEEHIVRDALRACFKLCPRPREEEGLKAGFPCAIIYSAASPNRCQG
jgi:hypothetical protein